MGRPQSYGKEAKVSIVCSRYFHTTPALPTHHTHLVVFCNPFEQSPEEWWAGGDAATDKGILFNIVLIAPQRRMAHKFSFAQSVLSHLSL